MSRSDDERVADILEAAGELALVVEVGRDEFPLSVLHVRAVGHPKDHAARPSSFSS